MMLDTPPKLSERGWQQQLISTSREKPGLLWLLGFELIWHDRATNAPRACPTCHAPLDIPRNDPGFPDLIALRGDTLYAVELKADRGRPTPDQKRWLKALQRIRTVKTDIWRPRMVVDIVKGLRQP